ncbi:MAG: FAD-binding oxidoreductase [Taibaiella sp.]|nr:FAD-binding oxidoreductase [Taibaiella sp.]
MFSYWEQQSFSYYNHIIVGAGIVGLSLAIELHERFPQSRIMVLERGLLPTGASTRNAGFACMGSVTELLDDLSHTAETEVIALFAARKKGLEKLRHRLGDDRIGYRADGSYELIGEQETDALDKLDYLNTLLLPVTGIPAFRPASEYMGSFGFSTRHTKALIENACEGALHSGKMMRALTDMAIQKGIEIKTGAEVMRFEEEVNDVTVTVKDPFRKEVWLMRCDTLSICTNAFTRQLLLDEDVVPGRGQVLVTDSIPGLRLKGIFHFDKGYYYFREIDGRVLFGGGRNIDFETENTTEIALNQQIQADLEEKLSTIILPGVAFTIAQRWAGIMAFGATKQPIVKAVSERVFGAFRMGGMGVALGSNAAERLAEIIAQKL